MVETCRCQGTLIAAFEQVALALGGVVASYPLPDEAVWDLAQALDLACERACSRMGCQRGQEPADASEIEGSRHPAITHLLSRLEQQRAGVAGCAGQRGERA